jgi:PAS domain-containing protein
MMDASGRKQPMPKSQPPAPPAPPADGALDHTRCQLIVAPDPPFRILMASVGWLRLNGYSEPEVMGRSVTIVQGADTCADTAEVMASALQVPWTPSTLAVPAVQRSEVVRRAPALRHTGDARYACCATASTAARSSATSRSGRLQAGLRRCYSTSARRCSRARLTRWRRHRPRTSQSTPPPTSTSRTTRGPSTRSSAASLPACTHRALAAAHPPTPSPLHPTPTPPHPRDASRPAQACVVTDAEPPWHILDVNERWCELTGFTRDEVLGNTCRMLQGPATCSQAAQPQPRPAPPAAPPAPATVSALVQPHPYPYP